MRDAYQTAEIRRARTMAQRTGGRMATRDIEPWDEGGNITQARTWHRADASREAAYEAQRRRNVAACESRDAGGNLRPMAWRTGDLL